MIREVPPPIRPALLLIGALALSLSNVASGQDRAIRFRDWDVLLTVNTDGSLDVTERLNIKFTGRWSRIQRDLSVHPLTPGRPDLDIRGVSATDAEGQRLRIEISRGGRHKTTGDGSGVQVGIWVTPYPMNEDRTVIIRYHVTNAIRFDELQWRVNDTAHPIDKVHVVVVFPPGVEPTGATVYTRESDAKHLPGFNPAAKVAVDATIETNGNTVGIDLSRALSFEVMTIAIGLPPGVIIGPIKAPERPGTSMTQWWPLLIPLIIFAVAFTTWQRRGDPGKGSYVVRYEPTDEMSPAELGTLVDDSMDGADLTATMVDLAGRGFLRIEEVVESHPGGLAKHTDHIIHIIRFPREWARLKLHESLFLTALNNAAGRSKTVRNSSLKREFVWPKEIRDAIYDSLVSHGYYLARPDKIKNLWKGAAVFTSVLGIGLALLAIRHPSAMISPVPVTTAAVLSALILFVFAPIMPARTPAGTRTREAALGLKEFLSRVKDPHNTTTMTSPESFQRYLPYAIALGVAGNWAKAFDDLYGGPPQWFVNGTGQFSASSFSRSIGTMSAAVASSGSLKSAAAL